MSTNSIRLTKGDAASVRKMVNLLDGGDWLFEGDRFACLVSRLDAIARYRVTRRRGLERRAYLRRLIAHALAFDDVLDRLCPVVVDHGADDPDSFIPF